MSNPDYQAGYSKGYLSDEDLAEIGYTAQSHAEHIENEYRNEPYRPGLTSDQHEFYWGLLDGANDKAKY
jgi:hypothetical protein